MRSNDPNRRIRNLIYQRMEDEISSARRQARLDSQAGQAKVEWILADLEKQRLQANLDSQTKKEEKREKTLKHQRFRRSVYNHVSDYVYEQLNDYVHEQLNELWDRYQTDKEFRERVHESIKRGREALGRAYASFKGTTVTETTGSPIADHPVNVSWNNEGKYTSGPEFQ